MRKTPWITYLAILVALCLPLQQTNAGTVTRPTKTCGTTSYAAEVSAGCTTIKSSEVDADLNAILTGGVNNIETANINASGLGTAAIANAAVTGAKIASATITTTNMATLSVSSAQLIVGASVHASQSVGVTAGQTFQNVEGTFATLPGLVSRGGPIHIHGMIGGGFSAIAVGSFTYTLRIYRDAVLIASFTTTSNVGSITTTTPLPAFFPIDFMESPAAGTYVYSVRGITSSANASIASNATNPGFIFAAELS